MSSSLIRVYFGNEEVQRDKTDSALRNTLLLVLSVKEVLFNCNRLESLSCTKVEQSCKRVSCKVKFTAAMHSFGFISPTQLGTGYNAQKRLLFGRDSCCNGHRRYETSRKRYEVQCRRGSKGRERRFSDGRRPNRVSELIKREISPIIDDAYRRAFYRELQESALLVSVVDVRCSDDLRHARVEVSVLGDEEQKDNIMRWLKTARKELRVELAHRVYLKHTPQLMFDESQMAQAANTVNILNRLAAENERKQRESGDVGPEVQGLDAYEQELFGQELDLDASLDDAIIVDDMREEEEWEGEGDSDLIIEIEDAGEDEDGDEGDYRSADEAFTVKSNTSGGDSTA